MNKIKRKNRRKLRQSFRIHSNNKQGFLRLSVHKSHNHIYCQIIDDSKGITVLSASSTEKEFLDGNHKGYNVSGAQRVGQMIGKRAREAGITEVIFDRGSCLYHGRIMALGEHSGIIRKNGGKI